MILAGYFDGTDARCTIVGAEPIISFDHMAKLVSPNSPEQLKAAQHSPPRSPLSILSNSSPSLPRPDASRTSPLQPTERLEKPAAVEPRPSSPPKAYSFTSPKLTTTIPDQSPAVEPLKSVQRPVAKESSSFQRVPSNTSPRLHTPVPNHSPAVEPQKSAEKLAAIEPCSPPKATSHALIRLVGAHSTKDKAAHSPQSIPHVLGAPATHDKGIALFERRRQVVAQNSKSEPPSPSRNTSPEESDAPPSQLQSHQVTSSSLRTTVKSGDSSRSLRTNEEEEQKRPSWTDRQVFSPSTSVGHTDAAFSADDMTNTLPLREIETSTSSAPKHVWVERGQAKPSSSSRMPNEERKQALLSKVRAAIDTKLPPKEDSRSSSPFSQFKSSNGVTPSPAQHVSLPNNPPLHAAPDESFDSVPPSPALRHSSHSPLPSFKVSQEIHVPEQRDSVQLAAQRLSREPPPFAEPASMSTSAVHLSPGRSQHAPAHPHAPDDTRHLRSAFSPPSQPAPSKRLSSSKPSKSVDPSSKLKSEYKTHPSQPPSANTSSSSPEKVQAPSSGSRGKSANLKKKDKSGGDLVSDSFYELRVTHLVLDDLLAQLLNQNVGDLDLKKVSALPCCSTACSLGLLQDPVITC